MKSPKRIPIAAAKRIAAEYGFEQVIIYARRHSSEPTEAMTTYGVDKANCKATATMGDVLKKFMRWDITQTENATGDEDDN